MTAVQAPTGENILVAIGTAATEPITDMILEEIAEYILEWLEEYLFSLMM